MKITYLLCLLSTCLLMACTNSSTETRKSEKEPFPIDSIKKHCNERVQHLNLDSLNMSSLEMIDTTFFSRWLEGTPLTNIKSTLSRAPFSNFYYLDFKETEKLFLFSILNDDETGYWTVFHFTVNKEKGEITNADLLANRGGEGGAEVNDVLNYNTIGNIVVVTSVSTYDEDIEKGYTHEYDSTLFEMQFKMDCTLITKKDSLHRMDTIWNKE